jgi:SAM-dependent methyltransferase
MASAPSHLLEPATYVGGDCPWLEEVLACPSCRRLPPGQPQRKHVCRHLETHFCLRNGIVHPAGEEASLLLRAQQNVWEILERAAGTYDLEEEKLLRMPENPETRAVLDWLRKLLRERGPRRILELNARRGWAACALAEDGHQVVAGDILDDSHIGLGCAVRLRDLSDQGFACVRAGPTTLPFLPEAFDCVYCFQTLSQTADLEQVFEEVHRVLRPGGLFLALQEPFRGALTTQTQRLHDATLYQLARWWLPGKLSRGANPDFIYLRTRVGATAHATRRCVPFCLARSKEAGLQTTVLPSSVALSLSSDPQLPAASDGKRPTWLHSLARAYALDADGLNALVEMARQALGYDLVPELLSHWRLIGNIDGVLLARKGGDELDPFLRLQPTEPGDCRRLDPLLLACAPDGFLPIHGVYPVQVEEQERYAWIQPDAGLIVPASDSLQVTVRCPAMPFCRKPVRIEIRLETERLPLAVFMVYPGQKVSLRLPIPASAVRHASLFVSIRANLGFLPSDFVSGPNCDTRLLSIQLHSICGQVAESDPGTVLRRVLSMNPRAGIGGEPLP